MYNFVLQEISEIVGKLKIFKLLIDGKCEYDEFELKIEKDGNLRSELRTIETRLFEIAECKSLPEKKFRDITPKKVSNKEYEIKTANLRIYLFHEKNTGHIIVTGGKKGSQSADIKHFRKVKNEYFKQKS